jgi:hypothetical protein
MSIEYEILCYQIGDMNLIDIFTLVELVYIQQLVFVIH